MAVDGTETARRLLAKEIDKLSERLRRFVVLAIILFTMVQYWTAIHPQSAYHQKCKQEPGENIGDARHKGDASETDGWE